MPSLGFKLRTFRQISRLRGPLVASQACDGAINTVSSFEYPPTKKISQGRKSTIFPFKVKIATWQVHFARCLKN